jgi:hypothetical protein
MSRSKCPAAVALLEAGLPVAHAFVNASEISDAPGISPLHAQPNLTEVHRPLHPVVDLQIRRFHP